MTGRLRELLDRPIGPRARRHAFALAAAGLILLAAVLLLTGRARPLIVPPPPPPPPIATVAPAVRPAQSLPSTNDAPDTAARSDAVVQRFLTGYLRFLYGRGPASRIDDASPELVRRLARTRPRISPATRRRRPRPVELRTRRFHRAVQVTAVIDDGGVASYPIALTLRRRHGRWLVTEVASD